MGQPPGPRAGPRRETEQHKSFLPHRKTSLPLNRALFKCYDYFVFYQVIDDIIASQEEDEKTKKKKKTKKEKKPKNTKKDKEKKETKEKNKVRNLEFLKFGFFFFAFLP